MKTPRNLALNLLNRLSNRPLLSDASLDETFRQNPHLSDRDRAFITHMVQGVLRWRLRLDWIIRQKTDFPQKKIAPSILNILRLALYQVFFLDRVPESAAVNEAVKQAKQETGARYVVSFVNGILRNICRHRDDILYPDRTKDRVQYLSVYYSYPEWLVKKWLKEWGEAFTENLLSAENRIPALCIRTNRIKMDRSKLIVRLAEEGVEGRPALYSPEGILLEKINGRIDLLNSFKEGLFQVQDQSAQITSHLLDPKPGETIVDMCAGHGGKTTHLAELMRNRGRVLAVDVNHGRLIHLDANSKRLGINCIMPAEADASSSLSSLFRSQVDGIMIDAPCSGLGTLARHPDGKWNKREDDIERLSRYQERIINHSASLLRSGGRMLYVTCTISKHENEGVVQRCLSRNKHLIREDLKSQIPKWGRDLVDDLGFFRTIPHIHHMDGFFAALFKKI